MFAGVCGGLGEYLSIDPTVIRLAFVLLTLISGHGLLAYLIMLLIAPLEPAPLPSPLSAEPFTGVKTG